MFSILFGVLQAVCIDMIRKVAKIKVKTQPCLPKMPHLNTPPQIYVTVLDDLHNTAQMYTQRKKA